MGRKSFSNPLSKSIDYYTIVFIQFSFKCNYCVLKITRLLNPQTTHINLDNILCPAPSDPFKGIHYRKWAVLHQTTLILIHGKILTLLSDLLIFRSYSIEKNSSDSVNGNEPVKADIRENGDIFDEAAFTKSGVTTIAVSTPDEAYSYNHLEIPIKSRFITELFYDQSDIISTRSFTINRSNSTYASAMKDE